LRKSPQVCRRDQLLAFREGRHCYRPKNYLLEYKSDAYPRAMAGYVAA